MNTNRQNIAGNDGASFRTKLFTTLCWVAIASSQVAFSQDTRQSSDCIGDGIRCEALHNYSPYLAMKPNPTLR